MFVGMVLEGIQVSLRDLALAAYRVVPTVRAASHVLTEWWMCKRSCAARGGSSCLLHHRKCWTCADTSKLETSAHCYDPGFENLNVRLITFTDNIIVFKLGRISREIEASSEIQVVL
jgi:hypothetical protein